MQLRHPSLFHGTARPQSPLDRHVPERYAMTLSSDGMTRFMCDHGVARGALEPMRLTSAGEIYVPLRGGWGVVHITTLLR
jgi:hypothetical protein